MIDPSVDFFLTKRRGALQGLEVGAITPASRAGPRKESTHVWVGVAFVR